MVEVETVAIFRDLLRKNKFYNNKVIVEEQISNNPRIKNYFKMPLNLDQGAVAQSL